MSLEQEPEEKSLPIVKVISTASSSNTYSNTVVLVVVVHGAIQHE